jgi:hypothetical protein
METDLGYRHRQVVQHAKRLWLHSAGRRRSGVFVHVSAVERAGSGMVQEEQKISHEERGDPKRGKSLGAKSQDGVSLQTKIDDQAGSVGSCPPCVPH